MNTIILPIHKVRVDRGRSQISAEAADHEIAVLKAVHGEGAVTIREHDVGDRDYAASAEVEHGRLRRVYDNRNDQPVARVFPTHYDLGRFGFDTRLGGDAGEDNSGAVNIERRPQRRLGAEDATAQEPEAEATDYAYTREGTSEPQPPGDAFPGDTNAPEAAGESPTTGEAQPPEPTKPAKAGKAK